MVKTLVLLGWWASIIPAMATTKLLPKPGWLVPPSTLIVVAEAAEVKQLFGSYKIPGDSFEAQVAAQMIKMKVEEVLLGEAPAEPVVVNIQVANVHFLVQGEKYLLFLKTSDKLKFAYEIVEALVVEKGLVPWHAGTGKSGMAWTPLGDVVSEVQKFIRENPKTEKADTGE